jgi:Tfp pilus assembly protein PilV
VNRRGTAIIEVLVALVVLAVAGTALVAMLGQAQASVNLTHRREHEVEPAVQLLDEVLTMSHGEIEARIGSTRRRGFSLTISASAPSLYALQVANTATGVVLLRTTLYRPDSVSP